MSPISVYLPCMPALPVEHWRIISACCVLVMDARTLAHAGKQWLTFSKTDSKRLRYSNAKLCAVETDPPKNFCSNPPSLYCFGRPFATPDLARAIAKPTVTFLSDGWRNRQPADDFWISGAAAAATGCHLDNNLGGGYFTCPPYQMPLWHGVVFPGRRWRWKNAKSFRVP